jgi:hypothetical protein
MLAGRLAARLVVLGHPSHAAIASQVAGVLSVTGASSKSDLIAQYGAVVGLGSLAHVQSELWVSSIAPLLASNDDNIRIAASDALFAVYSHCVPLRCQAVLAPLLRALEADPSSPTASIALLRALSGQKLDEKLVVFDGDDDDVALVALTQAALLLHDKDQAASFMALYNTIQQHRVCFPDFVELKWCLLYSANEFLL